jgi:hypothetical protein
VLIKKYSLVHFLTRSSAVFLRLLGWVGRGVAGEEGLNILPGAHTRHGHKKTILLLLLALTFGTFAVQQMFHIFEKG